MEAVKNMLVVDSDAHANVFDGFATDAILFGYASFGFKGSVIKLFSIEQLSETASRVTGLN